MSFTPEDLKTKYPGQYDDWKFAKNAKGEWFGSNKKQQGVIVSKVDEKGNKYPAIEYRDSQSFAPSMGAIPHGVVGGIKTFSGVGSVKDAAGSGGKVKSILVFILALFGVFTLFALFWALFV